MCTQTHNKSVTVKERKIKERKRKGTQNRETMKPTRALIVRYHLVLLDAVKGFAMEKNTKK